MNIGRRWNNYSHEANLLDFQCIRWHSSIFLLSAIFDWHCLWHLCIVLIPQMLHWPAIAQRAQYYLIFIHQSARNTFLRRRRSRNVAAFRRSTATLFFLHALHAQVRHGRFVWPSVSPNRASGSKTCSSWCSTVDRAVDEVTIALEPYSNFSRLLWLDSRAHTDRFIYAPYFSLARRLFESNWNFCRFVLDFFGNFWRRNWHCCFSRRSPFRIGFLSFDNFLLFGVHAHVSIDFVIIPWFYREKKSNMVNKFTDDRLSNFIVAPLRRFDCFRHTKLIRAYFRFFAIITIYANELIFDIYIVYFSSLCWPRF